MRILHKRGTAFALALALTLSLGISARAADQELPAALEGSARFMLSAVPEPQVGSIGGEWAVIGLARSGYDVPQEYWDSYYAGVEEYVEEHQGRLHDKKYTEYSRVVLALTAIGADPTQVAGYNLLTPLGDFDKTVWQGINGPVWALIALDSGNYPVPVNSQAETQATRQKYVNDILSRQLADGGWNMTDQGSADPDVTGMVLQALAGYQDQEAVRAAVERALTCLSGMQSPEGGYESFSSSSSESVVQVIVGLCALGVDLEDPRFVKNGNTLLDNLLSYRQSDGSFLHTSAGFGDSQMSSEQGLYGLAAAYRARQEKNSLYDMSDTTIQVKQTDSPSVGLPGKDSAVKRVPVTMPGLTFSDIAGHKNQAAMEELASRGMITGKGENRFDPDASMTRAEFATIVVQTLGLEPRISEAFSDVDQEAWYAPYVGTAHAYGIINGLGDGTFHPGGTITRQEAAVMTAQAARLCGLDTSLETYEVLNVLAQFSDYVTVASWARESVAFCYDRDLLDQSDLNVEPTRAILRCEVAQMLYNLLNEAKLL